LKEPNALFGMSEWLEPPFDYLSDAVIVNNVALEWHFISVEITITIDIRMNE